VLFNSLAYLIFLPIVFILYWLITYIISWKQLSFRWDNLFLLIASYIFYAWWDWRFLGLLVGMSLVSWLASEFLAKSFAGGGRAPSHKTIMWTAVILNLATLGFFKYYNFFVDSFCELFSLHSTLYTLRLVLPLGISFFTFQAIAYVVDAYHGKIGEMVKRRNGESLVDCLLYIGFFPKLLAGPIERPTHLLPQIQQKRVFEYDTAVDGCRQILWGLFKKIVIAGNCAIYVDKVWNGLDSGVEGGGSTLLLAAVLYTIQIYGDFSGYSDMAIGSAKLLGIKFRDNFLFPYFSRNMGEFWKRWHISLNTWFVDYVYIPVGGSRPKIPDAFSNNQSAIINAEKYTKWITIRNTLIIFLLSGLWHGADWSFVAWGGYHGLLLVILILLGWNTRYDEVVAYKHWYPSAKELVQMVFVFVFVTFGWVLFRAGSFDQFLDYVQRLVDDGILHRPDISGMNGTFMCIMLMFAIEWLMRDKHHGLDLSGIKSGALRWCIYVLILVVIFAFGGHTENFIYMYF